MRWPFRRRDAPAPGPSAGAQEIAAPAAPPAWASLPPLQRTLDAPIELTAPSTAVLGDLSQRWSPAIALEPLGHELGSLAPAGTIGLSGPPIEGSRSGPELVGRPAQQRTAVQRMATATTASSQAPTDTTLPSGLPPSAPRFHAAVVESPAHAVQRSLTSAADAVGAAAGEAAAEPGAMAPTEVAPSTSAALEPEFTLGRPRPARADERPGNDGGSPAGTWGTPGGRPRRAAPPARGPGVRDSIGRFARPRG